MQLKRDFIKQKIHELVSVAYGCTEIGIIGYASSLANERATASIVKLQVILSPFVYKNTLRVGVPGLGKCGIPMIAATGAVLKKSIKKLTLFSEIKKSHIIAAKELLAKNCVKVSVGKNVHPVYCKVVLCDADCNKIEVVVAEEHDKLISIKINKSYVFKIPKSKAIVVNNTFSYKDLTLKDLIEITESFKESDLIFLEKVFSMNMEISDYGLSNPFENSLTDCYKRHIGKNSNWKEKIILSTVSAIDARMYGVNMPVMSSCGSGDHGLTVSIPQYVYHKEKKTNELLFLRSLCLVNLITYIIKSNIGTLSAYCGSVVAAATATIFGIGYQRHLNYEQLDSLLEACICSFSISICDGAKPSCSFKVAAALVSGFLALDMVEEKYRIEKLDGIVTGSSFETFKFLKSASIQNSKYLNKTIVTFLDKINKK